MWSYPDSLDGGGLGEQNGNGDVLKPWKRSSVTVSGQSVNYHRPIRETFCIFSARKSGQTALRGLLSVCPVLQGY